MKCRVCVLVALLVAGCAGRAPAPDGAVPQADGAVPQTTAARNLEEVRDWELRGKLGVRTDHKGSSATLVWQRTGDDHRIRLFGPLGGDRIIIEQDPGGAVLRNSKRKTWHGDSAREVLYQSIGWHVPFDEMTRWVVGLPANGGPYRDERDEDGRLKSITQLGWEVRYLEYDDPAQPDLPSRVHLVALPETTGKLVYAETGEHVSRLEVRLVVKRWNLRPPGA